MYSDVWSPTLRQGDILGPIATPLVGNQQQVIAKLEDIVTGEATGVESWLIRCADKHVAVISHDCEFNDEKRERVLLARLHSVPRNITPERLEALRASNDVYARAAAKEKVDNVDSFLVDPVAGHFDSPHVVAFTTITPFSTNMLTDLHLAKCAELEHHHRLLLRRKLAWFFVRSPEDTQAQKLPPEEVLAGVRKVRERTRPETKKRGPGA